MEITALNGTGAIGGGIQRTTTDDVGKDAFLQLLITQLRYQDPLSPVQNEEFLAQLAQFSSLEQMQELNTKFESVLALSQSEANSSATSLIGRHVRASGDLVEVGGAGDVELGYFLSAPAQAVEVQVLDASGRVVRTLVRNESDAGSHVLTWDGLDAAGARVPEGSYTFQVRATDSAGDPVPATSTVTGRVEGVTFVSGQALLLVGGREVPLSSVLEVYLPGE